jgi:hypothetical protein
MRKPPQSERAGAIGRAHQRQWVSETISHVIMALDPRSLQAKPGAEVTSRAQGTSSSVSAQGAQ